MTTTKPKKSFYPTYEVMITNALVALANLKGSSWNAIFNWIAATYPVPDKTLKTYLGRSLKRLVDQSKLIKVKASYKLSSSAKQALIKKRAPKKAPSKKKVPTLKPKIVIPKDMKEFLRTINIGFDDLSTEKQHQFYEQMLDDMSEYEGYEEQEEDDKIYGEETLLHFLENYSSTYFPLFDILVHSRVHEAVSREMEWSLDHSEEAKKYTKAITRVLKTRKM